ncbi:NAD(+)/NADH kinase [Desulfovibrio mangrovi]|uniref:NAD(+)/NADH kinase n=1 Tax=Desulfovibrio mangrovi TaxID=2976983 RepID=UPI002246E6C6|nr:NAD(+)/NADH kinase [Desulfovibrio mangrovi]UZP67272.1 NAD(+)/NADH kinase [Desulfovibrio mangrovi]
MSRTIQSVFIVTKAGHTAALELADSLKEWFVERGCSAEVFENGRLQWQRVVLPAEGGLVLVLGGDGTMLSVARRLVGSDVPVLGVNLGRVGFLTEVSVDEWPQQLERLFDGSIRFVRRFALSCAVERSSHRIYSGVAVNDMVVHRGALARVIKLELHVQGERLGSLRADGLIVSTPTGSTGYAVSANGPLVHPDLDAFSVTPICPFLNALKPFVLCGDMELGIVIQDTDTDLYLTQDGQDGVILKGGDRVTISRAQKGLLVAELGCASYFERLRTRGFYKDQQ